MNEQYKELQQKATAIFDYLVNQKPFCDLTPFDTQKLLELQIARLREKGSGEQPAVPSPFFCPTCGKIDVSDELNKHECEMTPTRAVETLNEKRYKGSTQWQINTGLPTAIINSFAGITSAFTEFECIAIAEALLREAK